MVAGPRLALMAPLSKVSISLTQAMTASDLRTQMVESKLLSSKVYRMYAVSILVVFVYLKKRKRKNENLSIVLCLSNLTAEKYLKLNGIKYKNEKALFKVSNKKVMNLQSFDR